jgi:Mg2+-importing ATPase
MRVTHADRDGNFWASPESGLLASLRTSAAGLDMAEAERRLGEYGPNTLRDSANGHVLRLLLRQFGSPIVLMLIGAALLSVAVHDPTDGAIILGIVVVTHPYVLMSFLFGVT